MDNPCPPFGLTHKLCIPLITDTTTTTTSNNSDANNAKIELSNSLSQFRKILGALWIYGSINIYHPDNTPVTKSAERIETEKSLLKILDGHNGDDSFAKRKKAAAASTNLLCRMDPFSVRPAETLCLTLGFMRLDTDEKLARADGLLRKLDFVDVLCRYAESGDGDDDEDKIIKDVDEFMSKKMDAETSTAHSSTPIPIPSDGVSKNSESKASTKKIPASDGKPPSLAPSPSPLKVTLHSIYALGNPDYTATFYALPMDYTSRLNRFCKFVKRAFRQAGLLDVSDFAEFPFIPPILVNTRIGREGGKVAGPRKISAKHWADRYKGHIWAEDVVLEKLAICKLDAAMPDIP